MLLLNLDKAVKDMETQIMMDKKALTEMDRNLDAMRSEADRLKRKIEEETMFVEAMSPDKSLGSAMKKFSAFMTDVERTYPQLKQKHKDNIGILQKEFGYHPAFKTGRNPNEFSGAYLSMHPHPNKMQ